MIDKFFVDQGEFQLIKLGYCVHEVIPCKMFTNTIDVLVVGSFDFFVFVVVFFVDVPQDREEELDCLRILLIVHDAVLEFFYLTF